MKTALERLLELRDPQPGHPPAGSSHRLAPSFGLAEEGSGNSQEAGAGTIDEIDKKRMAQRVEAIERGSPSARDRLCPACRRYAWWLSIHGMVVCGRCHPPASSELVRGWLDPSGRPAGDRTDS